MGVGSGVGQQQVDSPAHSVDVSHSAFLQLPIKQKSEAQSLFPSQGVQLHAQLPLISQLETGVGVTTEYTSGVGVGVTNGVQTSGVGVGGIVQ